MTYKEKYKHHRWHFWFFVSLLFLPVLFDIAIYIEFGRIGRIFYQTPSYWAIAHLSYTISFGCFHYFRMRKAKRYMVLDELLKEPEYEKPPEDFMSEEEVETKSIAMWFKVNEKDHQN